ncbi:MAG: hypothetical protein IT557_14205 [Alphaproteobacteria bacterium]|nr:hypothetical protein [Alphaproteobacteria bacterium]
MTDGPTVEEFRRQIADFVARYRLPDGSVHPRIPAPADAAAAAMPAARGMIAVPHDAPAAHALAAAARRYAAEGLIRRGIVTVTA